MPGGIDPHTHMELPFGGTFWMHSHQGFQEQRLMAAPLIAGQLAFAFAFDARFRVPLALVGAGVGAASSSNSGRNLNLFVVVVGILRLMLGGGIF